MCVYECFVVCLLYVGLCLADWRASLFMLLCCTLFWCYFNSCYQSLFYFCSCILFHFYLKYFFLLFGFLFVCCCCCCCYLKLKTAKPAAYHIIYYFCFIFCSYFLFLFLFLLLLFCCVWFRLLNVFFLGIIISYYCFRKIFFVSYLFLQVFLTKINSFSLIYLNFQLLYAQQQNDFLLFSLY